MILSTSCKSRCLLDLPDVLAEKCENGTCQLADGASEAKTETRAVCAYPSL